MHVVVRDEQPEAALLEHAVRHRKLRRRRRVRDLCVRGGGSGGALRSTRTDCTACARGDSSSTCSSRSSTRPPAANVICVCSTNARVRVTAGNPIETGTTCGEVSVESKTYGERVVDAHAAEVEAHAATVQSCALACPPRARRRQRPSWPRRASACGPAAACRPSRRRRRRRCRWRARVGHIRVERARHVAGTGQSDGGAELAGALVTRRVRVVRRDARRLCVRRRERNARRGRAAAMERRAAGAAADVTSGQQRELFAAQRALLRAAARAGSRVLDTLFRLSCGVSSRPIAALCMSRRLGGPTRSPSTRAAARASATRAGGSH